MDKVLICPAERPSVAFLAQAVPLVAVPVLGETLVTYWVESLASSGIKDICVLATDRPESVRAAIGDGSRWGARVEVRPELKELSAAEAFTKLQTSGQGCANLTDVITLDHLPGLPEISLFRSYRDWFSGLMALMERASKLNRIGLRELQPGVWCGRRVHVAPGAKLQAPCWLGDQVQVGAEAIVGPNAVLEHRVVVDRAAEVQSSAVGPDTFVGALTKVEGSIAWGNTLIDWRNGSCTQVPDPFLLCSLAQKIPDRAGRTRPASARSGGWWAFLRRPWDLVSGLPGRLRG
jgi:NDP-sugar pyrophosphorylase family protein